MENWLNAGSGFTNIEFQFLIRQYDGTSQVKINRPNTEENRRIFNYLMANKRTIEDAFGAKLEWDPMEGRRRCRVGKTIKIGGYLSRTGRTDIIRVMAETMARLENAVEPLLHMAVDGQNQRTPISAPRRKVKADHRPVIGNLPDVFLWSKIGIETQGIDPIVRRKELERRSGNGEFWWGIGEKAAPVRVSRMYEKAQSRVVCFTKTRNPARGRSSGTVVVWSHYFDRNILHQIPRNVVITSFKYERYFSLVCRTGSPLVKRRDRGAIYSGQYENLLTGNRNFGQLTTFPVSRFADEEVGIPYPIEFRARLRPPHCVELKYWRRLTKDEIHMLNEVSELGRTVPDWLEFAARIRAKDRQLG